MAQQVPWDQTILDEFIRRSLLFEWIMRGWIGGMSRSQQAEHLGRSKAKHDYVQTESSGLSPRRRAFDIWTITQ